MTVLEYLAAAFAAEAKRCRAEGDPAVRASGVAPPGERVARSLERLSEKLALTAASGAISDDEEA